MTKGIFITGTGTGVGKTFVSVSMMKRYKEDGLKVTYMKPVETGGGGDTDQALKIASCGADIDLHAPYRFAPACSPHLAARESGAEIRIDKIVSAYNDLAKETGADLIIVEGAGGILVPINDNEYMVDIIKALSIPVILVTDPGLGTLNHTFLSLRELERNKIPIDSIVINNSRNIDRDFIYEDNIETIRRYAAPVPCADGVDVL